MRTCALRANAPSHRVNTPATWALNSGRFDGRRCLGVIGGFVRLNQVTIPAIDVEKSIQFYCGLGLRLIVRALPRYARFELPEGDATFSLHQVNGLAEETGFVVYFECADLNSKVQVLREQGFVFFQEPQDERWLWREARLRDPSGNVVCLYWAGEYRRFPPWRLPAAQSVA